MSTTQTWVRADGNKGITFVNPKKLKEQGITGVVIEGRYLGSQPNSYNPEKSDYSIEGDSGIYVLNSTSSLARQMENVKEGSLVRVNYLGMRKITKGKMAGKERHKFEVLIASDDESEQE